MRYAPYSNSEARFFILGKSFNLAFSHDDDPPSERFEPLDVALVAGGVLLEFLSPHPGWILAFRNACSRNADARSSRWRERRNGAWGGRCPAFQADLCGSLGSGNLWSTGL